MAYNYQSMGNSKRENLVLIKERKFGSYQKNAMLADVKYFQGINYQPTKFKTGYTEIYTECHEVMRIKTLVTVQYSMMHVHISSF